MALTPEVLEEIAFAQKMGFDKLHMAPPAQTREAMKQAPKNPDPTLVGDVVNVLITDTDIPVRIYIPEGKGPFPILAYFHGGGFVLMSIDTHDEICRQLCAKSGSVVMSVGYRLAPEHPYPAGPNDSLAAARWIIWNADSYNAISTKIAMAGDSAGGYMALYVAQRLKAKGIRVSAQIAAYPVTDHYSSGHASWTENNEGYILTADMMKWFWDNFLTDGSRFDEASLLRSEDFSGLAPALIMTANYDPLRDEGRAYADKLKAAGGDVVYKNYENVHGFFGTGEMGQEALQRAVDFLKAKFEN